MTKRSSFATISVSYSTRDRLKELIDELKEKHEKNVKYDDVIVFILDHIEKEHPESLKKGDMIKCLDSNKG